MGSWACVTLWERNGLVTLSPLLVVTGRGHERGPVCPQPPGGNAGQAGGVWQVGRLQEVPQHLQPSQSKERCPHMCVTEAFTRTLFWGVYIMYVRV